LKYSILLQSIYFPQCSNYTNTIANGVKGSNKNQMMITSDSLKMLQEINK